MMDTGPLMKPSWRLAAATWSALLLVLMLPPQGTAAISDDASSVASDSLAATYDSTAVPVNDRKSNTWQPPEPTSDHFDWIKLTSGEWLKGRLKEFRDDILEFDSEKLNLLKFDFDKIAEFRSPRTRSFRFHQHGVVTGTAVMSGGMVTIRSADSVCSFPRDALLNVSNIRSGLFSQWIGKLSVGYVGRTGNSEQSDFNALVQLRRQSPRRRVELKYSANFGSVNGEENVNNTNAGAKWESQISMRLYFVPIAIDYSRDRYQNIDHKYAFGAGLGVALIRARNVEWRVGAAAGRLTTEYRSVEAGTERITRSGLIAPFSSFDADVTDNIKLEVTYKVQIGVGQDNGVFHHGTGTLSVDAFGDIVGIDLSLTWDRVEDPTTDDSGIAVKQDDVLTSVGIGIEF